MSELPQDWTLPILGKLWNAYGEKQFTNEDAQKKASDDNLNQALSMLHRRGWITIKRASKDARKSIYSLKKPDETFMTILDEQAKSGRKE